MNSGPIVSYRYRDWMPLPSVRDVVQLLRQAGR
jgi:hypothetical protein